MLFTVTAVRNGIPMEREFQTRKLTMATKVAELWAKHGWLVSMDIEVA